jgi:hypothetical protein
MSRVNRRLRAGVSISLSALIYATAAAWLALLVALLALMTKPPNERVIAYSPRLMTWRYLTLLSREVTIGQVSGIADGDDGVCARSFRQHGMLNSAFFASALDVSNNRHLYSEGPLTVNVGGQIAYCVLLPEKPVQKMISFRLWLVPLLVGFCMFMAGWRARGPVRRLRRRQRGLCVGCGYDLTGNVSGACPECGQEAPNKGKPSGAMIH